MQIPKSESKKFSILCTCQQQGDIYLPTCNQQYDTLYLHCNQQQKHLYKDWSEINYRKTGRNSILHQYDVFLNDNTVMSVTIGILYLPLQYKQQR